MDVMLMDRLKHQLMTNSVSVLQPWPHWLSGLDLVAPSLRNSSSGWRTAWVLATRPSRPSAIQKRDSRCLIFMVFAVFTIRSVMNYLFSPWSVPVAEEASELQRCLAQSAHCLLGLFPGNRTTCSIVCISLCWLTTLPGFSRSGTAPNESRIAWSDLLRPERCADLLHIHLGWRGQTSYINRVK